jgi:hypothetical protein
MLLRFARIFAVPRGPTSRTVSPGSSYILVSYPMREDHSSLVCLPQLKSREPDRYVS